MKKYYYLQLIVVLLLPSFALSQNNEKQEIGGVRAGWHYATLLEPGNKTDTTKHLSSFYAGFFRDQRIDKLLSFGSGIEYFQNGTKYPQDVKRLLHTISIPLNLKLKIGPVFARGGAAMNFKVAERIVTDGEKEKPSEDDRSAWFDVAAFGGIGVEIYIFSVEIRYHWGLLEIRDDLKSRYLQIGASVGF